MSENKDNGKESQQEKNISQENKSKENNVLKINTKKGNKAKVAVPPVDAKFENTEKISPQYVSGLEETNTKLRVHLLIMQMKYGELTQWLGGQRKFLMDAGLDLQNKSRENEAILNVNDQQFDINFLAEQVKLGAEEYNKVVDGLNAKKTKKS